MYLFFVHSYVASKTNDGIKEELLKSLTDSEMEFKFG